MGALDTHVWVEERGCFVPESFRRIAEIINEYDPRLFLTPIPDELRMLSPEHSYAVVYENPNGKTDLVFRLKDSEINETLLARLWENDSARTDVLSRLETLDNARKALELKETIERDEANKEFAQTILKSPLHTFKHKGKKYT